jgi:alkanesulfonate monooxygenase SsuD/methylene tetrahydromethanopterin reductase-like flavin-dependent oxidoreductase (luciferase family)
MVNTLVFGGFERARRAFDTYRQARAAAGLPPAPEDRFSYMGFCYVGDSDAEAERVAEKICWFITVSLKQGTQFERFLPGQVSPELAASSWRVGRSRAPRDVRAESLIANGQLFAGDPDTVVKQIKQFRRTTGGLGRLIMMTRQGFVTHKEAEKSFTLAAKEVLPQLAELEPMEEYELASGRP